MATEQISAPAAWCTINSTNRCFPLADEAPRRTKQIPQSVWLDA
jgi:hypothetical protein